MRCLLDKICLGAQVLAGTAEQIPLADASVDAVFVVEAFHLMGDQHTVSEITRVLRPSGTLILMWNIPATPWEPSITAVERLLRERLPKGQEFDYDPFDLNPRRHASGEWRQAFAASPFESPKPGEFQIRTSWTTMWWRFSLRWGGLLTSRMRFDSPFSKK